MSPQGDKSSYSTKQKRQATKVERSARSRGRSKKTAQRIAWATVNKQTGGAKKKPKRSASSRKASARPKKAASRSTRKTTRKTGSSRSARKGSGQGGRKTARKSR